MFVTSTSQVGVSQRVVATLVACAVALTSIGLYNTAQAANLTNVSNTLTDSEPSVLSGHTFRYTVPAAGTAIAPGDTTTITFPAGFTGVGSVLDGDVTVSVNGTDESAAATVIGAGQDVTVTGITVAAGQEVVVAIADTRVTNPAKVNAAGIGDSYEFTIDTGVGDTGRTRVVIIDNVLVTAIVDTVFEFTITGLATSTDVNGESTTGSSTATTLDFAQLVAGTPETLGQQLDVTTNAINGFVVTVEQDDDLRSSTGADIDSFIEGAYTDSPSAWVAPTNVITDENTWGHWGLTSEDSDLNADEFGSQLFVAASTTPRQVFSHDGPSDGTTVDVGTTQVAYKIEITSLQEAGDDYNTTLTYIATPTF